MVTLRNISIAFVLVLCSCEKISLSVPVNTKILGHGGMGISSQYPINSLESILNALNIGADGFEVDVQLSKDGQLVAFHDELMYESTNLEDMINGKTWEEIENGFYTEFPNANYNIVRLDDIFSAIEEKDRYTFTLDCKLYNDGTNSNFEQDYITAVIELLQKHDIMQVTTVESVDTGFLLNLKRNNGQIRAYYYVDNFEDGFEFIREQSMEGITINQNSVSAEDIMNAHQDGKKVAVFGIAQTAELEQALIKKADLVQVDNLRTMLNATD